MTHVRAISRREFLHGAAAAALTSVVALADAKAPRPGAGKRPNLLVIVNDQQHAGMLRCAGNRWLKTPAMDSLAATGMRFERAYCTAPVCVPSRFSLLTGLYPSAVGVRHNGSRPTKALAAMPQRAMGGLFRKAGYETAYGGKVHLPGAMRDVRKLGFAMITGNARGPLADACAAFLRRKHDKPWLLFASFINPHDICYMAIRDHNAKSGLARGTPAPLLEAMKPPPSSSLRRRT